MKVAYLLLIHQNIDHIYALASEMPNFNFYVHLDLKVNIKLIKNNNVSNVFFIPDRVDIKWAGFSMVQATINLIKFALNHKNENEFFHLLSGDDVVLNKNNSWDDSQIFIECRESNEHRYRMRFNTPHADTKYQRKNIGKILTQFYKKMDKFIPTKKKFYFGSQWFSIRRTQLEIIMSSIESTDINFFKKKLCPDEHFFQYLLVKANLLENISSSGNKRFIKFDKSFKRGASPIFLNYSQLRKIENEKFWFARKVVPKEIQKFYLLSNED